jgi:hypothetical protein
MPLRIVLSILNRNPDKRKCRAITERNSDISSPMGSPSLLQSFWILRGIESATEFTVVIGNLSHTARITLISSSLFEGLSSSARTFKMAQRFSIGFRSGKNVMIGGVKIKCKS